MTNKKKTTFIFFITVVITVLITEKSYAIFRTWNGGNGSWHTSSNWSPAGVPTAADDISIQSGEVTINDNFTGVAKGITIGAGGKLFVGQSGGGIATLNVGPTSTDVIWLEGELKVESNDVINIDVGQRNGIYNNTGDIRVAGQLHISNVIGVDRSAIFNNSNLVVLVGGHLDIQDVTGWLCSGIKNQAICIIANLLTITNIDSAPALINIGGEVEMTNVNSRIEIVDASEEAIVNTSNGTFENRGSILIENSSGYGILNHGGSTFDNTKEIVISDLTGSDSYGILNEGVFTSDYQGDITVDNIGKYGIHNNGITFENEGDLYIRDTEIGIYNSCSSCEVENWDNIFIDDVSIGILNVEDGHILNWDHIEVTDTNASTGQVVLNEGEFDNYGTVLLDYVSFSNKSTGEFLNNDSLIMIHGHYGLSNEGLFENDNVVLCENIKFNHIINHGVFTNNSEIKILNNAGFSTSVGIYNTDDFQNYDKIYIENMGKSGLINILTSANFINHQGDIQMIETTAGNYSDFGIDIQPLFEVKLGATFEIDPN